MAIAQMARASDPRWLATLIESLMSVPDADGVSASTLARAWRDARERVRFLTDVEMRSAHDCGDAATVGGWIAERRVIALAQAGTLLLPAFQFDADGAPRPEIAGVLAALDTDVWTAALWFRSPSGSLGDARPMDVIATEPAKVLAAARQDAHALVAG